MFIFSLYWITGNPSSDIFLVYFLPLLIAADKTKSFLAWFIIIFVVFLAESIGLAYLKPSFSKTLFEEILPRGMIFLFIFSIAMIRSIALFQQKEQLDKQQKSLEKQQHELDVVRSMAMEIGFNQGLGKRLESLMDVAMKLLSATGCGIFLREGDSIRLVALRGIVSPEFKPGDSFSLDQGMVGRVIQSGRSEITDDYATCPFRIQRLTKLFETVVEIPLRLKNEVIGVIADFAKKPRKFNEDDIRVLESLAQYASVAIHDVQLLETVQKQAEKLQVQTEILKGLNAAGQAMINTSNLEDILNIIVKSVWELTRLYNRRPPLFTSISLVREDKEFLEVKVTWPRELLQELKLNFGLIDLKNKPGIVGKAFNTRCSQLVPDVTLSPDYLSFHKSTKAELAVPMADRKNSMAELAVPMRHGDCPIGVINIENSEPDSFSQGLQEDVQLLASQAAAIINSTFRQEAETLRTQAEKLREVALAVTTIGELQEVAKKILKALYQLVSYDRATFQLIDGDTRYLLTTDNLPYEKIDTKKLLRPISQDRLIEGIFCHREICILPDPQKYPNWEVCPTTADIKSWIGIPLIYDEKPLALITLDSFKIYAFNEDSRRVLSLFANHAASVFQCGLLFDKEKKRVLELDKQQKKLIRQRDILTKQREILTKQKKTLTQQERYLATVLDSFKDYRNLALIGLIYGADIHSARNKLGLAKTYANDIKIGDYQQNELPSKADRIIVYINEYLAVLDNIQKETIKSPLVVKVYVLKTLHQIVASQNIPSQIQVKFFGEEEEISAPDLQLRQVFYVIIQNALDAMGNKPGTLSFILLNHKTNFIQINISDTGPGIPQKMIKKLFTINEERTDLVRGCGMGLAWTQSFLKSYGGEISVKETSNKGTTISVDIPRDFSTTSGILLEK